MSEAKTPTNPRTALREARQQRVRVIAGGVAPIRVFAANEDMLRVLRHPRGMRFRAALDQAVEWPNDSFTARRIADGSVRTDGPASSSGEAKAPDEKLNARQRSAARKAKDTAKDTAKDKDTGNKESGHENHHNKHRPHHQSHQPQPAD
jgi:hypothetical protein